MTRDKLSVLLMTADQLRHRYTAAELHREMNLVGIVIEEKSPALAGPIQPERDREILARHFSERDRVEDRLLTTNGLMPEVDVFYCATGELNGEDADRWIKQRNPDCIVVYGTTIIRQPLLTEFAGRMVNLHLGLSPYYRGAGTNFWPLVNGEPECVGATIHLIEAKVDAGPILSQVRPVAEDGDRAHELGTKALWEAVHCLAPTIRAYANGDLLPVPQQLSGGRLYRLKDFNADSVLRMWRLLDAGMISDFLRQQDERRARFPIV